MSRRKTRTQNEWNVAISGLRSVRPPSMLPTRSAISAEALFVNVTARMASAGTPLAMSCAIRNVIARVFPVPAPARMSTGPSVVSAAARCSGFNSARRVSMGPVD